jgi:hypothetical protein
LLCTYISASWRIGRSAWAVTEVGEVPPAGESRRPAALLSIRERWLAFSLGFALLGFACYLGFVTRPEAGVPALALVAGLLLFVAAFGHRIQRLRWRDLEVALDLFQEAQEAEKAGDEEQAEALRTTARRIDPRLNVFGDLVAARSYETAVLTAVGSSLPAGGRLRVDVPIGRRKLTR